MTSFQRKRIRQIEKDIARRESLMKKDTDDSIERFFLSRWTAAISLAVLIASAVFALTALWSLIAS